MTQQPERSRRTPSGPLPGIMLAVAILVLATSGLAGQLEGPLDAGVAPEPRPFDPPTLQEQVAAGEAARADARVQELLGDHHVFLGTALRTDKVLRVPVADHPRLFDVWFYDYETDKVVWAVVDSATDAVVGMVHLDFPFQPPLVSAEIHRARELALGLDAVASRVSAERPIPVTAMLASGEETACPTHRCVVIAFIENAVPRMDLLVLVDLSEDRVLKVAEGESSGQEVYQL